MTRTNIILAAMVLTFASGAAVAQMNDLVARTRGPDVEVAAAQQSLADAMAHLQKVRDPMDDKNEAVIDLVKRAQKELLYEDGAGPPNPQ